MQGPSELGASGALVEWSRFDDLPQIEVPTLVIGAQYDTMDPDHMRAVADQFAHGTYLHCPEGAHMAMWDDADHYVPGVLAFLRRVCDEASP
jgi:proline iminopeptidase